MTTSFQPKPARADKPEMTLDRVLSRWGIASRTVAAEMIRAGRVTVDHKTETDPQRWIEIRRQRIGLDGKLLQPPSPFYIALNKPKGYLTSHGDPQGRPTVYDLLAKQHEQAPAVLEDGKRKGLKTRQRRRLLGEATREAKWLFPVGRLDQDTTGLLLMTNDSLFAEQVTNPLTKVAKTYLVKINALLSPEQLEQLRQGVDLGRGERSGPAQVTWLRDNGHFCWIELVIHEGKNRQVRRMIEALGAAVLKLTRIKIGTLALGDLPVSGWKEIRPDDVLAPRARPVRCPQPGRVLPDPGRPVPRKSGQPRKPKPRTRR